jgi:hypothetical protein
MAIMIFMHGMRFLKRVKLLTRSPQRESSGKAGAGTYRGRARFFIFIN